MDRGVHEGAQMHSEHVSDVSDGGKQSEGYISLLVHYHVTASQNALAWASNGARGGEAEGFTSLQCPFDLLVLMVHRCLVVVCVIKPLLSMHRCHALRNWVSPYVLNYFPLFSWHALKVYC